MREEKMEGFLHEAEKPLARYKDNNDLDKMMREMDREGDPMAAFLKKKNKKEDPVNGWLNFLLYALRLLGSKKNFCSLF
jgi:pre-mRNA-splicing factor CWC26